MDRRTLLAISLCFCIYLGWFKFYVEPHTKAQPTVHNTTTLHSSQQDVSSPTFSGIGRSNPPIAFKPTNLITPRRSTEVVSGTTQMSSVSLGDSKNFINNWSLTQYKKGKETHAEPIDLHSVTQVSENLSLSFDDANYAYLNSIQGQWKSHTSPFLWFYEDDHIQIQREITSSEILSYLDLKLFIQFKSRPAKYAFLTLSGRGFDKDPEAQDRQIFYWTKDSIERVLLKDPVTSQEIGTPVKYIGIANRYFIFSLIANGPQLPYGLLQPSGESLAAKIHLVYPIQGNSITIPTQLYFGPKDLNILRTVHPSLDQTVDFGWFTLFAYPILTVLKWIYSFCHNYGVAIIILTLLLKVITYPLTYKSMKSMKKMAKLQPQMEEIRKRFKDDKEALNREIMQLMKTKGYNPAAGCLPMIIQMPIFFALYRVLYSSIELYHAPFALWIQDLSVQDPYYMTPALLTLTMYLQQKMTPTTVTDPMQAKMMQFMPVIFGVFMVTLPSGLAIYMLVNTVAGIAQQLLLNRKFAQEPQEPEVLPKL